ncbi:SPOR domain-containing protein [Simplicispira psychrophila]|uniref:SPOR domain-containing protein n=1 Tax=Simplicispira psychrophila TaxID=80882 RepID=UPI00047F2ED9|nr:SPOR domain-containing protein [Simplicispira psychrophila]
MAFFKFRWPGQKRQDDKSTKPSREQRTENIDVMRRRARHRLIGAGVLVLLGVIGFPMLFDTQPRPIPVDIPIEIPDRNRVAPLVVPDGAPAAVAPAPASRAAAVASLSDGEEVLESSPGRKPAAAVAPLVPAKSEVRPEPKPVPKPEPKPVAKPEPKPEHKPDPKPVPKPEPKPEPKPVPKPEPKSESKPVPKPEAPKPAPHNDDAARARALLEGRSPPPQSPAAVASIGAQEGRFIVQIGAFADADKAREARQKVERTGLKTYTQVVETKDGKRIRVRVGPLVNRAEAEKAAARIRALDLSASILTL